MTLRRRAEFPAFVAIALALKLFLTSGIGILALYAMYDDANYVLHAAAIARGAWFGPYDQYTLIKMPFFPLFLAAIADLHIALPLAHQLLYFAASLAAVLAVAPLLARRWASCALFAIIFFNPYTFDDSAWRADRSEIAGSLALLSIACACAIHVRRGAPAAALAGWCAGLALSFSTFWLTREESVWLVPAVAIVLVPFAVSLRRLPAREAATRIALLSLTPALCIAGVALVSSVNGSAYGWPTLVENESPEFLDAFDSLARIGASPNRLVPVPRASLEIAYRVSPAARELRAAFDGKVGAGALKIGCTYMHVCDDIVGGWFIWGMRAAASAAGETTSGGRARAYYERLSSEIDRACAGGTIRCRSKPHGQFATFTAADVGPDTEIFGWGIASFFLQPKYSLLPDFGGIDRVSQAAVFDSITHAVVPNVPPYSRRDGALSAIAAAYRFLTLPVALLAAVLGILRLARAGRERRPALADAAFLSLAMYVSVFALVAILSIVTAYLFTSFLPQYFSAAYPLLYFAAGLIVASEACALQNERRRAAA